LETYHSSLAIKWRQVECGLPIKGTPYHHLQILNAYLRCTLTWHHLHCRQPIHTGTNFLQPTHIAISFLQPIHIAINVPQLIRTATNNPQATCRTLRL